LESHFEVRRIDDSSLAAVRNADAVIGVGMPHRMFDGAERLRAIATISAGYDSFDVEDLTRRRIVLMNTPGALTETTADLAFSLILATARRIVELADYVKEGRWTGGMGPESFGVDVHGKTLGVVGFGRIGAAIARRGALGFGMRVLYYNRSAKLEAEAQTGAQRRELAELLRESDFVCVTVPLSPETVHLIGSAEFAQMRPHAIFVNIARGQVADESALVQALQNGTILGAGLDVFEKEPLPLESPLRNLPNVVAVPHIGSAVAETREAMAASAVENLVSYLIEGKPLNVVNPNAL
jgi:lactate dehydrogenase-like 2-hydroxyacid dehydrogenase